MKTTQAPLRAYFGGPALKAEFVSRMEAHIAADQLAQGEIGKGGRGCAVWCTYDEYDHSLGPRRLGVPEWFERLRDGVFEGLPADEAQAWALSSLVEVPVGAEVELIRRPFLIRLLRRLLNTLWEEEDRPACKVVSSVIDWLEAGEPESKRRRMGEAALAAYSAADASSAGVSAAAAAMALAEAEESAGAAAEAAAEAAEAAAEAAEAAEAALYQERRAQRDDLIDLLRGLEAA